MNENGNNEELFGFVIGDMKESYIVEWMLYYY